MSRKDSGSADPFTAAPVTQRTLLETTSTSRTKEIRYTTTVPGEMCATLLIHILARSNSIKQLTISKRSLAFVCRE